MMLWCVDCGIGLDTLLRMVCSECAGDIAPGTWQTLLGRAYERQILQGLDFRKITDLSVT